MTLKPKLDDEDLTVLEVVEDPIWLGEFLRSTTDGEIDTTLHPAKKWKYRDYQRQFLSDSTEFILYTGGRAIGKCQPASARIYTDKGYQKISDLIQYPSFVVYSLTHDMTLEQRRAMLTYDTRSPALTIVTESGHKVVATKKHPLLTPNGYTTVELLKTGDYIGVSTFLPHESTKNAYQWHELRILGYIFLLSRYSAENYIVPRYKKMGAELEIISDRFKLSWNKRKSDGAYILRKPAGPFKHQINTLMRELSLFKAYRTNGGAKRIPVEIKTERLDNIQVFLEAVLAQFATISTSEFSLNLISESLSEDFQELLLKFGIETIIVENGASWTLKSRDYRAVYRLLTKFTLPGIAVANLRLPPETTDATEYMRFDRITKIFLSHKSTDTYALYVYETNNYISDNVFVHNSVVLEDKIIYDVINQEMQFPVTKESVLVTPNQAQLTPLLGKLITRFSSGRILKEFLKNRINRSEGTMRFPVWGREMIFNFRIAGSRGENNMVGLHIPRITGDEMQLFPLNAWTQLGPAYNQWEPQRQQLVAGVPNGLRNSVLYLIDQQTPKFKKYHIPSHMNPFYTLEDDNDNLRKYGGEQDDRYQQLVLGRHGQAAFQVIPRETINTETYAFYSYRYNSAQSNKGVTYEEKLERPLLPKGTQAVILAIDPGFVDPTIIQVFGRDAKGIWRTFVRYRLTRIDFNEQQHIIDWIATFYNAAVIAMDIGAGGNGASMMHNLMYGAEYAGKGYDKRIQGIQFSEQLIAGFDDAGEELKQDTKAYAANELAKTVQEGRLVFSELDHEGLSQLERVAKQKSTAGRDRYFVLSDRGAGPDEDDHIFASYICFVLAIRGIVINPTIRKLGNPEGSYSLHGV